MSIRELASCVTEIGAPRVNKQVNCLIAANANAERDNRSSMGGSHMAPD